jgi:hypothetical protein
VQASTYPAAKLSSAGTMRGTGCIRRLRRQQSVDQM